MKIVREENVFISPPYSDCPCREGKSSYGVFRINDDHYLRKCDLCGRGDVYRLPTLKKRIIYLDQFALSQMMKSLDREGQEARREPADHFYLELFNKLDRLGKLMLIVCPYSPIHQVESKGLAKIANQQAILSGSVDEGLQFHERFEKVRKLFVHLSYGTKFHHYETIRERQVLAALKVWIQGSDTFMVPRNPSEAIMGKIHVWLPSLYSSIDSRLLPAEVKAFARIKANLDRDLEVVVTRWRQETENRFADWFNQEIVGHASALLNAYRRNESHINALRSRLGLTRFGYPWNSAVGLMMHILETLEDAGWVGDECMLKAQEFFASAAFRQIPVVRIGSALWAGLAHDLVHAGRKKADKSFANDVTFISAYLPYCDAMFIDKTCANILKAKLVNQIVPKSARVFSMDTKDAFLKFLNDIESTASPEHHTHVCEVYGEGWIASSVEISCLNLPAALSMVDEVANFGDWEA